MVCPAQDDVEGAQIGGHDQESPNSPINAAFDHSLLSESEVSQSYIHTIASHHLAYQSIH